ncbi:substrate-binding domain-containing protein [Desulfovibrio inopinatus]|uniref:substrate-binding domain-containing protein n=1 Tax=Desulfovibrio inopinatus TaxID=102109 RepID=UPI000401C8B6|nr:substrate-binding domain-containing protein [Desulfovibrio inopinatus]
MKRVVVVFVFAVCLSWFNFSISAHAAEPGYNPKDGVIRVYGAGGPDTALRRVAKEFQKETGTEVVITAGPQSKWSADAKKNADILWGTAEQSMTAFLDSFMEFDTHDVLPIYIRPSVIAVKKGNPKNIKGIHDLLQPGMKIVVTEGGDDYNTSGTGVWEDVVGRLGSLEDVKAFRKNIVSQAKGSGASFRAFKEKDADAWITWAHWAINNPDVADFVEIEPERRIYRDLTVVTNDKADPASVTFIEYLRGDTAREIFESEGWSQ